MRIRVAAILCGALFAAPAVAQPAPRVIQSADYDSLAFRRLMATMPQGFAPYRLAALPATAGSADRAWTGRPAFQGAVDNRVMERADGSTVAFTMQMLAFPTGSPNWFNAFAGLSILIGGELDDWEEARSPHGVSRWNECRGGSRGGVVLLQHRTESQGEVVRLVVGRNNPPCDPAARAATVEWAKLASDLEFLELGVWAEWKTVGDRISYVQHDSLGNGRHRVWMRQTFAAPQGTGNARYDRRYEEWTVDCRASSITVVREAARLDDQLVTWRPIPGQPFSPRAGSAGALVVSGACGR